MTSIYAVYWQLCEVAACKVTVSNTVDHMMQMQWR